MNNARASTVPRVEAGQYEIRLQGHLTDRLAAWFDGLTITHEADGTTVLHGPVIDQAALHGLLQKIRDLGLPLVGVGAARMTRPSAVPPQSQDRRGRAPTDPAACATPAR